MLWLTPENEAGSAESIFLDNLPYDDVIQAIYGMNNSFFRNIRFSVIFAIQSHSNSVTRNQSLDASKHFIYLYFL